MPNCILPCASSLAPSGQLPLPWLPVLTNIEPPALRCRKRRLNVTVIGHYMMTSFTLLHFAWNHANHCGGTCSQLMSQVGGPWREDWQSATVVNSTLVVDPIIRLPAFDLHRRQWSLLNRFRTGQGHCNL